ncbi:hypothetical protein [Methanoplanus limicola]|nr:hypothetical protein [Methanoplanus limicola]
MKKSLKFSMLAAFVILLAFTAPSVSAFEISGTYTEEGQKWLNEHWGEKITLGELAKIAYTEENYEKIKENVDPKLLEEVWSQTYFWGEHYPPKEEVVPGPKIFNENSKLVEDPDGSILADIISGNIRTLRSGIIVDADPVSYSGGRIRHSGSGYVYGADPVGSLMVESKLHGDGNWLSTSYNAAYGYDNSPYYTVSASGSRSPVSGTLYQSQTVAQSADPTGSGSTWSPSYYYS